MEGDTMSGPAQTTERIVLFKGNPLHLEGREVRTGDRAPDFTVLDTALKPVHLSDFAGQIVVLVAVPSLDTPVCDLESRKFNQEAVALGENVKILVVSADLPFAQKRWCGAHDIKNVLTVSDYRDRSFGKAYGVLIRELQLLARSIFVVDRDGRVQYRQIVEEISQEPDYGEVIQAIDKLTAKQGT
jgi:thioredoxin-dependent peroxiredoxin